MAGMDDRRLDGQLRLHDTRSALTNRLSRQIDSSRLGILWSHPPSLTESDHNTHRWQGRDWDRNWKQGRRSGFYRVGHEYGNSGFDALRKTREVNTQLVSGNIFS